MGRWAVGMEGRGRRRGRVGRAAWRGRRYVFIFFLYGCTCSIFIQVCMCIYAHQYCDNHQKQADATTELGATGVKPFVLKLKDDLGVDGLVRDLCFLGGCVKTCFVDVCVRVYLRC